MRKLLALIMALIMLAGCSLAEETEKPPFFPQLRLEDMQLCENATTIVETDSETGEFQVTIVFNGKTQGSSTIVCYYDINGDLTGYDLRSMEKGIKFISYDLYGNVLFGFVMTENGTEYYGLGGESGWLDSNWEPVENPPKEVNLDDLPPILVLEMPAEEAPVEETADEAAE